MAQQNSSDNKNTQIKKFDPPESTGINKLLDVMDCLRDPVNGCPWDLEQSFNSLVPYIIEESYEVVDAIEHGANDDICEELGDLLLQIVFCARIADEEKLFNFNEIAQKTADKMIGRHPHVFSQNNQENSDNPAIQAENAGDVEAIWEERKRQEKAAKNNESASILDDVTLGLPALLRSLKLQKKAAKQGFVWTDANDIFNKLDEEIDELKQAINQENATKNSGNIEEEIGDILFVVSNLSRHFKVNPEEALRKSNDKFYKRFHHMEKSLKQDNRAMKDQELGALLSLWQAAKRAEKA